MGFTECDIILNVVITSNFVHDQGLPVPIIGSMVETAALFVAYSSFQNLIRAYSFDGRNSGDNGRPLPLSIPQLATAAAGAGFATSFILFVLQCVHSCGIGTFLTTIPY